jgi:DNA-directed RNA polymerase subunit RPC12/RpoP
MNDDEAAAIIRRMLRQLEEDDATPNGAPRCDGCGRRVELAPHQRRTSDGETETLYYCADCRVQAMFEVVEDSDEG